MIRVARLVVLVCLIAGTSSVAHAQSAAVSACGQIVSGDAHLTNDLDCPPSLVAAVIVEGGSLDLRGFTIRGAEVGVYCVHPIWEENVFVYKKCRVFGGTIAGYSVAGVAAKKLDLTDMTFTGGHGLAVIAHKLVRFANLAVDIPAETQHVGIFLGSGSVKGTNLTLQGGVIGVWARSVYIDGMTASGAFSSIVQGDAVRLRNATLTDAGRGVSGGKKVTIESSVVTGHTEEGVRARRVRLVGSTVTGSALDIHAERLQLLDGSTCGTSNGLGVCTAD
jgi:hypothetical protein